MRHRVLIVVTSALVSTGLHLAGALFLRGQHRSDRIVRAVPYGPNVAITVHVTHGRNDQNARNVAPHRAGKRRRTPSASAAATAARTAVSDDDLGGRQLTQQATKDNSAAVGTDAAASAAGIDIDIDIGIPTYPAESRRLGEEGTVTCTITCPLPPDCEITITSSSGYPRLDRAAVDHLSQRALAPLANRDLRFHFSLTDD